ncbi:Copiatype Polyprotein [Phytophthora palmivora]|uniref:Copiatype Polyprotein n=1 Tax=Phytophthora palmivora TaxID=4796 RepID=A0A2P4X335_9STRA|nr:Copiatype Polyprotein [Phytophthora palmivora]
MMHESGLSKSMWMLALEAAVYLKNRVFCKGAGRTPYELMFGIPSDLHHIRTFGSLVYCHTPLAKHTRLSANCRVSFLIGYREDVVGCQVYFPTEHKRAFVSDVKINENIKYKDRYGSAFKSKVDKWLHTFDEYIYNGAIDDNDEGDNDHLSEHADCDDESAACEQHASDDLDDEDQQL